MHDLLQDLRFALRALAKTPTFTLLAVITIALGVGANTAAFSMVRGVVLKRLPYAANDHLVRVEQPSATNPDARFSVPEITDYRAQAASFAGVVEYHSMPFQLYGDGEPQRVQTGVVSDGFFNMVGVRPILGRTFLPGEEVVGAPPVVLLSYRYWMDKMNGDPHVVGTTFTMNDKTHTVVGVLPPLPNYPDNNDIWMPAGACPFRDAIMYTRTGRMLRMFAVLKPGRTVEQARSDVATVSARLHAAYPADYPAARKLSVAVVPLTQELTAQSRPLLFTLLAAAAFVLIIAMTNFANIMLARQMRRQRELAVRAALGAGSMRLFRHLATESLCVSLAGGALGVAIAYSGMGLLRSLATRVTPRASEITIDGGVLAFALILSVSVGLVAAIVPFLRRRASLSDALRAGSTTMSGSRQDRRARGILVGAQVAVAFVLLVGAGLMVSSLVKLEHVDAGIVTSNVISARVDLDWTRYNNPQVTTNQAPLIVAFVDRLTERLRAQPGAQSVAVASNFPLNLGGAFIVPFQIRGQDVAPDRLPKSELTIVSSGYFKTMGIPVLRGRPFADDPRDTANGSVMISQRLAGASWPGKDPVGQQISLDGGKHWATVAGVVGDVRSNGLSDDLTDEIYLPFATNVTTNMRVLVRTAGDPAPMGNSIRDAVREIDPKQPVVSIQTLDAVRGASLSEPRVTTALLASFAVLALVITAAGLAGVIAYGVSQRMAEIGIRVALGAESSAVVGLMMRQGLVLVAVGLVGGVGLSLAATRLMTKLLFDTPATDPRTFGIVGLLLLGVAVVACWVPARRALQVDPVQALRPR